MAIYQSILAVAAISHARLGPGMFTLINGRLSLSARLAALESAFHEHYEDCVTTRREMFERFDQQDANVLRLHQENQASNAATLAAVTRLEGSTNTFDQLLPSIKLGIEADARRQFRRKGVQRIAGAVISTLVAISALIPLAQLLLGLQISIHAG